MLFSPSLHGVSAMRDSSNVTLSSYNDSFIFWDVSATAPVRVALKEDRKLEAWIFALTAPSDGWRAFRQPIPPNSPRQEPIQ